MDLDIAEGDDAVDDIFYSPPVMLVAEPTSLAERYCQCRNMETCHCGENNNYLEWQWDDSAMTAACQLAHESTEVTFHPRFSVGTACIRADRPLRDGYQHYFEIKVLTPCFGTDIMVGLGTEKADIRKCERRFASLLGSCNETWGLSYKGGIFHNETWTEFHSGFGQGSIIGVHVDLWRGILSYYINRKLIGVAFCNLRERENVYYPMVSSTAAKSRFRLISARSHTTNLQYLCCNAVRQAVPYGERYLHGVLLPPSLKVYLENNMNWLLLGTAVMDKKRRIEEPEETSRSGSPDESESLTTYRRSSSSLEQPLRGSTRMAQFIHRLAAMPTLTLQINQHRMVQQPNSAPEIRFTSGETSTAAAGPSIRESDHLRTGDDQESSSSETVDFEPASKRLRK